MDHRTMKLFARPSFIEGAGSVMDIGGTLQEYNFSEDGLVTDAKAIKSDWLVIGEDLRAATRSYAKKTTKSSNK